MLKNHFTVVFSGSGLDHIKHVNGLYISDWSVLRVLLMTLKTFNSKPENKKFNLLNQIASPFPTKQRINLARGPNIARWEVNLKCGSYESTFYRWTAAFYGAKISRRVKKSLSFEGRPSSNFSIEIYSRNLVKIWIFWSIFFWVFLP